MPEVNYLAVIVAALSSFVLGGLWYSPLLFARPWMALTGLTEERLKGSNMALVFGGAFVLSLLGAFVFALFIGPMALGPATAAGFAAGLAWVAGSFGINYLFERKSLKLWMINGGYHVLQYTLIGAILGAWK